MKSRGRRGGLSSWAINRPIGTVMLTSTLLVLGAVYVGRIPVRPSRCGGSREGVPRWQEGVDHGTAGGRDHGRGLIIIGPVSVVTRLLGIATRTGEEKRTQTGAGAPAQTAR